MDALNSAATLLAGLLAIAIPAALVYLYGKKRKLPLKIAALGAVFFIAVQVLHAPLVIFTQNPIYSLVVGSLGQMGAGLVLAVYLGAMAALFEELARYLIFKYIMKERSLEAGKLFGLGWGGIESIIILGILGTITVFAMDQFFLNTDLSTYNQTLIQQGLNATAANQYVEILQTQKADFQNRDPLLPFVGLYERIITMIFHVCASILVMQSILDGKKKGLLLALGAHFVLDFGAVAMTLLTPNVFLIEGAVTVMVAATVLVTAKTVGEKPAELLSPK